MSKDHYVHDAGKGSRPRPVDQQKYNDNYDRIFGKKEVPVVESVFICMHCNTLNNPEDVVCKNCGKEVGTYPNDCSD